MGNTELRLVASANLGSLGPKEGPPLVVPWKLAWSAIPLLPWAILPLLLLLRSNRNWRAWAIVIPYAVALGAVALLGAAKQAAASGIDIPINLPSVPQSVPLLWLGIGALLLVAYRFERLTRGGVFAVSCVVLAIAGGAGLLFATGLDGTTPKALAFLGPSAMLYAAEVAWLFFAVVIAAFFCRKRYTAAKFGLVLLGAMVVPALAVVLMLGGIAAARMGPSMLPFLLFGLGFAACGGALMMYVLLLPFLLLVFWNSLYRQRFLAMFKFPTAIPSPEPAPPEALSEQPPASDGG